MSLVKHLQHKHLLLHSLEALGIPEHVLQALVLLMFLLRFQAVAQAVKAAEKVAAVAKAAVPLLPLVLEWVETVEAVVLTLVVEECFEVQQL